MTLTSANNASTTISVLIGDVKVVRSPAKLRTTLGSCIGVALYDPMAKVAGLAHVVLPKSSGDSAAPGKFADTAVPYLLNEVLRNGARRALVKAKIAGGASMFRVSGVIKIGSQNDSAVRMALEELGILLAGADVGGEAGRRMTIDSNTGEVEIEICGMPPRII